MLKRFTLYLVALASFLVIQGQVRAFSLLGPITGNPAVSWQTTTIGYNFGSDIGGPMNRGEGYRWNVPVVYVAFDDSFIDYFGNYGVSQVENALLTFNSLTNFSLMSSNLNEYPLRTTRVNFRAQALNLLDLKSTTMRAVVEELGLTEAERYIFSLRDRNVTTFAGTTYTNYLVIQRNFDPIFHQPSSFVNGTLYTYDIRDPYQFVNTSDAVERPADPRAFVNTSVSYSSPTLGMYFTGLTRDDVGGLRYLYGTNNIAGERLLPDTQIVVTNSSQFVLTTGDLGLLTRQSTNTLLTPPQMQTLFPGVQFSSVTTNVGLVNVTSVVSGSTIVITPTVTNVYSYQYANVVTNFVTNTSPASLQTIEVTSNQFGLTTNILSQVNFTTNEVAGNYYVITNGNFGYELLEQINVVTNEQRTIFLTNYSTTAFYTNNSPNARVLIEATNDLYELIQFSTTNPPAAVLGRYPGLLITGTNIFLTNVVQETYFSYITNYYTDPAFIIGRIVVGTNQVTNVIAGYSYTFANVVTNQAYAAGFVTTRTLNIGFNNNTPYDPAFGSTNVTTNITVSTSFSAYTNGTFYIVPTNLAGYNIVATQFESPLAITNTLVASGFTSGGVTLSNIIQQIRYRTNTVLLGEPILVQNPTNIIITTTGIRQELVRGVVNVNYRARALQLVNSATIGAHVRRGTDHILFRRLPYDSVLARVINPVTNYFATSLSITNGTNIMTLSATGITNLYTTAGYLVSGTNYNQIEVRAVTTPDFLFQAEDLGFSTDVTGIRSPNLFRRVSTANWDNNDTINGTTQLAGPGVITGPVTISYNNIGPYISNQTPRNLDHSNPIILSFTWGSFDGSGADPVVYPIGTGLDSLESQILNGQ